MTPSRTERTLAAALATGLVLLGLWMYRPWEPRPFDTLDFSEFLPLLRGASGIGGRTAALINYYVHEHGRLNLLSYLALAAKWTFLGDSPVRWQWARVIEMLGLLALVAGLLRRLALGPIAAVAGASVFLIGRVAGEGWTRMTLGEDLGTLCVLIALHLALGDPARRRTLGSAVAIGTCLALGVLAKEMLIGLVPFTLWIAFTRSESGELGRFRLDRRGAIWGAAVGALPSAVFLAALWFATHAAEQGFSSLYGTRPGLVGPFVELFFRPWFLTSQRASLTALLPPGNALFVLLILGGVAAAWRTKARRPEAVAILLAAALTSGALAALYLPWPYFNLYYAIPFLLGTALVTGLAVDAITRASARGPAHAFAATALVALATAPVTNHYARIAIAEQQVDGALVANFARYPGVDSILAARREPVPLAWAGTAPTLRRYALATGVATSLPPARDILCPEAYGRVAHGFGRSLLVTYGHYCGALPGASITIVRPFRYVDVWWTEVRTVDDSVLAQILVTAPPAAP